MCRLRTYLSLSAAKTSQNLPNDGATPTLRNGRVQLLSAHLDCFNGPRPAATSHKWPRKQRKVGLWSCLRAVRSDSPVLEGRPTVLHNIDHSNIYKNGFFLYQLFIWKFCTKGWPQCSSQNFKQIGPWRKIHGEIWWRDCGILVLDAFRDTCILLCPRCLTSAFSYDVGKTLRVVRWWPW